MSLNKLVIGTAQFGTNYGIANEQGKINKTEQKAILDFAQTMGIDTLDTAIDYGDSEINLGNYGVSNFKLITKIPPIPKNLNNVSEWISESVKNSLRRLGLRSIYGVLMHRSDHLLRYRGEVYKCLRSLKDLGLVKKIGVSIYSPNELEDIIANTSIDIVQAPINLIDRRLQDTGWLYKLKEKEIEIHARSIFLQGLLLMPKTKIPKKFSPWRNLWKEWYAWQNNHSYVKPLHACIGFVNSLAEINYIVVGVDSFSQLKEIVVAKKNLKKIDFPNISCNDEKLLYPSNWLNL